MKSKFGLGRVDADGDSLPAPVYHPLDPTRHQIRLIEIVSSSPTVICKLSVVSLLDKPTYYALYMWGATLSKAIIVDGHEIPVTENLMNALKDIDHQWTQGNCSNDPAGSRRLWADAISINQEDLDEKSHQIPMMKDIYCGAIRTFSWLGPSLQDIYSGFDLIENIGSEVSTIPLDTGDAVGVIDWMQKYPKLFNGTESLTSILELLYLPYWRRVWIFQELLLSNNVLLICGKRALPFDTLVNVASWHSSATGQYKPSMKPAFFTKEAWWLFQHIPFNMMLIVSNAKNSPSHERPTLYTTMLMYRATNPRGYVYGFMGVTGFTMKPAYHKPVADVYCDFAEQWLRTYHDENKTEIYGNLWFMQYAGLRFANPSVQDLPSWAPNFAGVAAHDESLKMAISGNADTGVFDIGTRQPRVTKRRLRCLAVLVGRIEELGPIRPEDEQDVHNNETWSWILSTIALPREDEVIRRHHPLIAFAYLLSDVQWMETDPTHTDDIMPLLCYLWSHFQKVATTFDKPTTISVLHSFKSAFDILAIQLHPRGETESSADQNEARPESGNSPHFGVEYPPPKPSTQEQVTPNQATPQPPPQPSRRPF